MTGRVITRRALLGTAVLGATVPVLAACGGADPAAPTSAAPPSAAGALRRTVWSVRPDGPLPATGDEGAPLRAVRIDGSPAPASVRDGALVSNLPDAPGAVYVVASLAGPVRSLGARFAFGPGSAEGSLCLAAFDRVPPPSTTNCHLVVTPERWILSVAEDGALVDLADGRFARGLAQDGTPLALQADLDGPRAVLRLPDGQDRTVDDDRLAGAPGTVANWEFYKNAPGAAEVRLYETWAA